MADQDMRAKNLPVAMLRLASKQISSTPEGNLARVMPDIVGNLAVCLPRLAIVSGQADAKGSEEAATVQRFTTQISALLRDQTFERRWAGVVLVKAVIEHGGHEFFKKNATWIKSLLHLLQRPNISTIHVLTVLTLTRVFLLFQRYPSLKAELVTPTLNPFITACLNITRHQNSRQSEHSLLLWTVLESFGYLLPLQPTVFRPFQSQLQDLLRPLIALSYSDGASGAELMIDDIRDAAQYLFVQLHRCAPKATAAEEWQVVLATTVETTHNTADLVFRSLIEFWNADGRPTSITSVTEIEVQSNTNPLRLPSWKGITAGCERLRQLLGLLKCIFTSSNAGPVNCKVGQVLHLLSRILVLRIPSSEDEKQSWAHLYNTQISREELMGLLSRLPLIHTSAMDLLTSIVNRLSRALMSNVLIDYVGHLARVFETEKDYLSFRVTCYGLIRMILEKTGSVLDKSLVKSLSAIMTECVLDCSTPSDSLMLRDEQNQKQSQTQEKSNPRRVPKELQKEASALLVTLLGQLPTNYVPSGLRARMDQSAILSSNQEAISASTLNPGSKSSVLPFLARAFPDTTECEAILRPRLPPITTEPDGLDGATDDWIVQEETNEALDEHSDDEDHVESRTLPTPALHNALVERKRKADDDEDLPSSQYEANSIIDREQVTATSSEPAGTSMRRPNSEKSDSEVGEAPTIESASRTKPSKKVRFSNPESELLEQPQPLALVGTPEGSKETLAASPIAASSAGEATDPNTSRPIGESKEEKDESEDDDDFEVPPLTMEQDTDEEDEE